MAIKFNIKALEEVDEGLRSQYKAVDPADPTKGFVLDLEGAPQPEDTGALKRALERVRAEKDEAIAQLKAKGNSTEEIEALRKSAEEQISTLKNQIKASETKAREALHDKYVSELASELGGDHAAVLVPHLRQRLVVESPDGTNLLRVLGPDGKASALSVEDLKTEFKNNKIFAPVIQAGRASGSGTPGGGSSNGGAAGGAGKPELPKNATATQKVEWLRQQNTPGYTPE